jgi:uncharacterized protein YajQ (UPF0234 family)
MPSFDTVCEADMVKVKNGVENSAKEIATRFDFKGTSASIEIKDSKIKVQASIQEDKVRVSGAKRDDLQAAIALLRKEVTDVPLDFNNFRD